MLAESLGVALLYGLIFAIAIIISITGYDYFKKKRK